jgi:polyhydroxybutyrate depolymerase
MLYGAIVVIVVGVVANVVAVQPWRAAVPVVWPALFAATILAWTQVVMWLPYGVPGLRAVLAVLLLVTIDAVVIVAMEYKVREPLMVALLAPQLPLAYLVARWAVARARRGEVPDWAAPFARLRRRAGARERAGFDSPGRAQGWLEWRQHGRALPAWVALVLPFEVTLLWAVRHEPAVLTAIALTFMLLTPPFLAAFVAATVGRAQTAFQATRPLSTAALVAAKLKMALASTLLAWAVALAGLSAGIALSGAWPLLTRWFDSVVRFTAVPRAIALPIIAVTLLVMTTWKQLVQGLCIGLTGRDRLIKGILLVRLCSLILLGPAIHLVVTNRDVRAVLWDGVPWVLAALACLKLSAATWTASRLSRDRLLGQRALVLGAAVWLGVVLAVFGAFSWLLDTPHAPRYFLLLLAVAAVPIVRPSAAALALAWNRHRGRQAPSRRHAGAALPAAFALLAAPLALALLLAMSFHARNRNNGAIVSSGVKREYLLHLPRSYDPAKPTPLVISMHGAGMSAAAQRDVSQWDPVADEHGFIVVYPSGFSHGSPRVWRMGDPVEVQFIADLIDALKARYTIDPARIYADGVSNGGGMAFVLSCTLSDRIAAVGMVGSAQLLPWTWCMDTRPVPMIAFHGTADEFAPYHGGHSFVAKERFPDIPTWAANWARRNGCAPQAEDSSVAADVNRRRYTGCARDAEVVLYTIVGGGHTWPGGGPLPEWFAGHTSQGVNASRAEWAFFSAHPLAK